jgi:hypothetical protein
LLLSCVCFVIMIIYVSLYLHTHTRTHARTHTHTHTSYCNVYIYVYVYCMYKLREANPGMTFHEVAKRLGERWREMDAAEKRCVCVCVCTYMHIDPHLCIRVLCTYLHTHLCICVLCTRTHIHIHTFVYELVPTPNTCIRSGN